MFMLSTRAKKPKGNTTRAHVLIPNTTQVKMERLLRLVTHKPKLPISRQSAYPFHLPNTHTCLALKSVSDQTRKQRLSIPARRSAHSPNTALGLLARLACYSLRQPQMVCHAISQSNARRDKQQPCNKPSYQLPLFGLLPAQGCRKVIEINCIHCTRQPMAKSSQKLIEIQDAADPNDCGTLLQNKSSLL